LKDDAAEHRGDAELDPFVDQAFNEMNKEENEHGWRPWNTCKTEARALLAEANKLLEESKPKPPPPPPSPPQIPGGWSVCFREGTQVHAEAGLRNIETVSIGEQVWAYDHDRQVWALMRVIDTEAHDYSGAMVTVKAGDEAIESTPTHPYWVVAGESLETRPPAKARGEEALRSTANGRWVAAQDIRHGDKLLARDGRLVKVEATETAEKTIRIFNLLVDRLNSYAVGGAGLLVNNM